MGIVILPDVWEPNPWSYFLLFSASSASILLFPFFLSKISSRKAGSSTYPSQFPRFQRSFLVAYCLLSVVEGIQNVFGEIEYVGKGLNGEQMALVLSSGGVASLLLGTFLAPLSDVLGQKKACMFACLLQLAGGILRGMNKYPSVWMTCIFLSLSSSIYSCSFETWMVTEHEKLGFRKELLSDTFWLMTFMESASLIGSQVMANSLISWSSESGLASPAVSAFALAIVCILYINSGWDEHVPTSTFKDYKLSLSSLFLNDCLAIAFMVVGFSFSVIAYDYQEIAVLVVLFCIIHGSFGLIVPSLARLRSMYVPNELRAGMMSLSLVPANSGILYVLIQGGYNRKLENSTIMALSSFGLFSAAVCIQLLKRKWWQRNGNWHVLGQKKACMFACLLQLAGGIIRGMNKYPSVWLTCIFLSLSLSIYSCSFETWMVSEHEKLGFRKELLSDTFWLMTFMESASLVGSQVMANSLISCCSESGLASPVVFASALAIVCILHINSGWDEHADGREVALGLIYPCLLGARMFGSTMVPWIFSCVFSIEMENCLAITFVVVGFSFSVIAYDYQEIAVLVVLFCIIHGSFGLIVPSLARLRSMYVPNELRAGMMSLSLVPANAGILYVLIQGGYNRKLENSTIMALSSFGLFSAAVCIQLLKRKWWQRNYNRHVL
ncbi:Molybdate-anion transporter [Nymphaea thermarum]|nr:Molybdate-anion transporter [Nymphaea thermarum]